MASNNFYSSWKYVGSCQMCIHLSVHGTGQCRDEEQPGLLQGGGEGGREVVQTEVRSRQLCSER